MPPADLPAASKTPAGGGAGQGPVASAELRRLAAEDGRRAFLRMVSHELRTPLNAIIGFSDIITGELHGPIGDPRYREHARIVRDSGLQLLALINQMLEIARLEAGVFDLDLRPELVRDVVEEALLSLADAAARRGVGLQVRAEGEPGRALCDRRGLRTALAVLGERAIAASAPGGVVRVRLRRGEGQVLIEVCDDGEGCGSDGAPAATTPFTGAEGGLARDGGAGLGLPLARLLCRAMGGRLRVRATSVLGTVATVRMPVAA